jgi:hypothetical protein
MVGRSPLDETSHETFDSKSQRLLRHVERSRPVSIRDCDVTYDVIYGNFTSEGRRRSTRCYRKRRWRSNGNWASQTHLRGTVYLCFIALTKSAKKNLTSVVHRWPASRDKTCTQTTVGRHALPSALSYDNSSSNHATVRITIRATHRVSTTFTRNVESSEHIGCCHHNLLCTSHGDYT